MREILCPDPPRRVPAQRLLGLTLRTAHLLSVGTLLGGHVFAVDAERLVPFLAAAIVTGGGMIALELVSTCMWLFTGKGLAVTLKLGLLLLVPVFWDQRVLILVAVTVIAGYGSHMSARFRHYSLLSQYVACPRAAAASARSQNSSSE